MEHSLNDILEKVYELEGLLLLARSREQDNIDASLRQLILAKGETIEALLGDTFAENEISVVEMPESESDEASIEINESLEDEVPAEPEGPENSYSLIDDDADADEDSGNHSYEIPDDEDADVNLIEDADEEVEDADEEVEDADEEVEDTDEEVEDTDEEDDDDDVPLTLDEALQRNMSRDLRKAFSLNDRFRYRRELFANNDVEMNDTLNLVETMHSFSEAEDFFYGDLEWDKEAPEVIDFMNVIRNHFYNREQE